jgi:hypothetical protein
MELERLITNEQVKGSSPFVPSNFIFFGVVQPARTPDFESGNIGSNPLSEANLFY